MNSPENVNSSNPENVARDLFGSNDQVSSSQNDVDSARQSRFSARPNARYNRRINRMGGVPLEREIQVRSPTPIPTLTEREIQVRGPAPTPPLFDANGNELSDADAASAINDEGLLSLTENRDANGNLSPGTDEPSVVEKPQLSNFPLR